MAGKRNCAAMSTLLDALLVALYLQIPIVFGGVWHMVAVKKHWLAALCVPIAEPLFGRNKTWRGLLLVPLLTAVGALLLWPLEWLQQSLLGHSVLETHSLVLVGIAGGLGYVLAELPNSWVKRRLGIGPGETPRRGRLFFLAMDQIDSGIGAALAYMLYPGIHWITAAAYVVSFPLVALAVKRLLFLAQLKSSPA